MFTKIARFTYIFCTKYYHDEVEVLSFHFNITESWKAHPSKNCKIFIHVYVYTHELVDLQIAKFSCRKILLFYSISDSDEIEIIPVSVQILL